MTPTAKAEVIASDMPRGVCEAHSIDFEVEQNMLKFDKIWWPFVCCYILLAGCGSGKSDPKQEEAPTPPVSPAVNSSCSSGDLPPAPPAAGQLVLTLQAGIDPCSVSGYIVGNKDLLKVQKASGGEYFINNVPAGKRDVIITAGSLLLKLDNPGNGKANADRGKRLESAAVLNGVRTDLGKVELPKFGSLSGTAKLIGQTDNAGIDVYVPGTSFLAKTDAEGRFSIPNMPVGKHNLYFEKDGFHRAQVESIAVETEKVTSLSPVDLVLSTGAEGFVLIENGSKISNSRAVGLTIGATPDAVLMKIAETESFEGSSWKPVATSTSYVFTSPGQKTLFVKFSNANGLESSPFRAAVLIDLFSDGKDVFTPSMVVQSIFPPQSVFSIANILLPKNAEKMIVSDNAMFLGAEWENPSSSKQWTFSKLYSNCGEKNFYLKFKDKDNFESPVAQRSASIQCWSQMSKTGAPPVRERHTAVWTGSEMIIWGGTTTTSNSFNDGGIWDSPTDSWTATNQTGAPSARFGHTAVWTGSKMIVWGGRLDASGNTNTGASYSPATNSWTPISTTGAPTARLAHSAVWTGSVMIVFGGTAGQYQCTGYYGQFCADGGIYNPSTDTWSALPTTSGPAARYGHAGIWTGSEMIIWGGVGDTQSGGQASYLDGFAFNPGTGNWRQIASAPNGQTRNNFSYVWDGQVLQIWGGIIASWQNSGLLYDASGNTWSNAPTSLTWKPAYQSLVNTGDKLLFWGGTEEQKGVNNDGYILSLF